jgi:hypothetical protein
VNLLRDNTDIIKKNRETLTDASNDVGLEVNTENTRGDPKITGTDLLRMRAF